MNASLRTTLYAVRHGETVWNAASRQQGHLNSPLTENGRQQAQRMAEGLAERGIDVIVSSDLGRAVETAEIVAKHLDLPFTTDAGLRERHLGVLQGTTKADFARGHPEVLQLLESDDPDYAIPGGESQRERHEICVAAVEAIVRQHAGKTVLLVAHSGSLRCLFHRATGLPVGTRRRFSMRNGAINRFEISQDDWHLVTWGDLRHLDGLHSLEEH